MQKVIFWPLVILAIFGFSYYMMNSIYPFFIAGILSYMLQPVVSKLDKIIKSRNAVSAIVIICFLVIIMMGLVFLIPLIYHQIALLVNKIPTYNKFVVTNWFPVIIAKVEAIDPEYGVKIRGVLESTTKDIFTSVMNVINNIWSYTLSAINTTALLMLIPFIMFYALRDWESMVHKIGNLVPRTNTKKVTQIFKAIDNQLSAYIRGQMNVCLILSAYYVIGLSAIGLDFALILGIVSGFIIIIPYIGFFIAFAIALLLGIFSFGWSVNIAYIAGLYLLGQVIEGYFLTPRIIGNQLGVHPVFIIFSILVCGSLFGFTGIFFAVPIAGVIKVILEFTLDSYKSSKLYKS